ncbi:MAG TPA: hypothetical protein VGM39_19655 [Kofleriaceae bacterium]
MRRATGLVFIGGAIVAAMIASAFLVEESHAELENGVFTSRAFGLRMVVPRGWRSTDQASYPGMLLWMLKSQPEGTIVLTAEPLDHKRYCTWPLACRSSNDSLSAKYACMLRTRLTAQKLKAGPVQAGPKENEEAGLPSVWFEYDDGKKFLRQAVAVGDTSAVTLVLSAPTNDARAAHVRPFETALRTLRPLTSSEAKLAAAVSPADAGVPTVVVDGSTDASINDAGAGSAGSGAASSGSNAGSGASNAGSANAGSAETRPANADSSTTSAPRIDGDCP